MAREPQDIFIREFFEHPGWENVFAHFEILITDLKQRVLDGTRDDFLESRGRLYGAYDAISHLKTLMKSYTNKG